MLLFPGLRHQRHRDILGRRLGALVCKGQYGSQLRGCSMWAAYS